MSEKRDGFSRRRFLSGVGISAASALLAACGGNASTGTQPASGGAAAAPTTASGAAAGGAAATAPPAAAGTASGDVQFWDMVWGPPEYIDTAKKLVDQFNKANPSIKVSYQSNPWSSWPQVFTTAIGSGSAPNISTGGGFQAINFYPQGAILEIDDVVQSLKPNDFLSGSVESLKFDGHYVALPWGSDIRVPFYRKDLFDAAGVSAPTTWDELRAGLKKLTGNGKYGIAFSGSGPLGSQQMMAFMINNGGGLFDTNGKLDVMNDRNVEAFTFISDLIKDGVVHPGSAGFADADLTKAFSDGSAAMTIFQRGFEERAAAVKDKTVLLAPMSGPHGDKGTLIFQNNVMLYKDAANPEATKTFLQWWSANALPLWTEGHCGQLPARTSIASDAFFQNNAFTKQILEQWVPIAKGIGAKTPGTFPVLGEIDSSDILKTLATDILQGMDVKAALQKTESALKGLKSLKQ